MCRFPLGGIAVNRQKSLRVADRSVGIFSQRISQIQTGVLRRADSLLRRIQLRVQQLSVRIQALQQRNQIGRPQCRPVFRHSRIGHHQAVPRLGHIQIQIKALDEHLLTGRPGQLHAALPEQFAVRVRQEPAPRSSARDSSVIDTHHKEYADTGEPGPLNVAGNHAVHLLGKRAQPDLLKAGIQQPDKIFRGDLLISDQIMNLIQQRKNLPIDLTVFHLPDRISFFGKSARIVLQFFLRVNAGQKRIQTLRPHRCRSRPLVLFQRGNLLKKPLSGCLQLI